MDVKEFESMSFDDKKLHYSRLVNYIADCEGHIRTAEQNGSSDRDIIKKLKPLVERAKVTKKKLEPIMDAAYKEQAEASGKQGPEQ